jgi:hypothetical protein
VTSLRRDVVPSKTSSTLSSLSFFFDLFLFLGTSNSTSSSSSCSFNTGKAASSSIRGTGSCETTSSGGGLSGAPVGFTEVIRPLCRRETVFFFCFGWGSSTSAGAEGAVDLAGIGSRDKDFLRADKVGGSASTSNSSVISGKPGGRATRGKVGDELLGCGRDRAVGTWDGLGLGLPAGTLWDSRREPNWLMSVMTCVDR